MQIRNNTLCFGDGVQPTSQRTLRIPDDGRPYPLPPGLDRFPLRRVQDHASRMPPEWNQQGGGFLPMYQREAMWICFHTPAHKPRAVKVGVGKVCAITGERWSEALHAHPQNYIVSELWGEITSEAAPTSPVTAREYARHGLPWFDLYDEQMPTLSPSPTLAGVQSIEDLERHAGHPVGSVVRLPLPGLTVRDGDW